MTKLILFDIDGTLIKGKNEVPVKSFSVAIKKIFGIDASVDIMLRGHTDKRIMIEVLNKRGIETEKIIPKLEEMYKIMAEFVRENIKNSSAFVAPGVKELLEELRSRGYISGLLTGNLSGVAKVKLENFGLWEFFQVGSFGDTADFREDLVEEVIKQAEEKFDVKINRKDVFYIGDLPQDIEAGKKAGVKTISLVGTYTKNELMKHEPDYFLDNFSDPKYLISIIENF
jgi:phosphoglycolate phosphatase-like HAD superfamily hydrolase